MDCGLRKPQVQFLVMPLASHGETLPSFHPLSFFVCKMGTIRVLTSPGCCVSDCAACVGPPLFESLCHSCPFFFFFLMVTQVPLWTIRHSGEGGIQSRDKSSRPAHPLCS